MVTTIIGLILWEGTLLYIANGYRKAITKDLYNPEINIIDKIITILFLTILFIAIAILPFTSVFSYN